MKMPTITHPQLIDALRKAYSAERAASYAYIGHAGSLRDPGAKTAIRKIEQDEWDHRRNVLVIMCQYQIPVSRFYEWKYALIGRVIGLSCYMIGRFMPYFFAGKLESGNVCEYIVMMRYFNELGITEHDAVLYEMGIKEKEHEVYFQQVIEDEPWLPLFERIFSWGAEASLNDVDLGDLLSVEDGTHYCKDYKRKEEPVV